MLSFSKILLILAVVVGVMIAFRVFGAKGKIGRSEPRPPERPASAPRAPQSADLAACPRCKVYTETRCDRADCPL